MSVDDDCNNMNRSVGKKMSQLKAFLIIWSLMILSFTIITLYFASEIHTPDQQTPAMTRFRSEFEKNATNDGLKADITVQIIYQNSNSTNEWAGNVPFVQKVTFRTYDEYECYLITNWVRLSEEINRDVYGKNPITIVRSFATFDIGSNVAQTIIREKKFGPLATISSNSLVNVPIRQMRIFTTTEKL